MRVLLVDDDPVFWDLFQAAIRKLPAGKEPTVGRLADAADLLPHLESCTGQDWPDLLLLDQRMPRMDGTQLLSLLRRDERYRALPVCLLSSSDRPGLVTRAYGAGANLFLVKPLGFRELCDLVALLFRFFTDAARLPPPRPYAGGSEADQ
jgi:two-component system response regulator